MINTLKDKYDYIPGKRDFFKAYYPKVKNY